MAKNPFTRQLAESGFAFSNDCWIKGNIEVYFFDSGMEVYFSDVLCRNVETLDEILLLAEVNKDNHE